MRRLFGFILYEVVIAYALFASFAVLALKADCCLLKAADKVLFKAVETINRWNSLEWSK